MLPATYGANLLNTRKETMGSLSAITANLTTLAVTGTTTTSNLIVLNDSIITRVVESSNLTISNNGTGPALIVNQVGAQDIADIQDDGSSVLKIYDGGNVSMGLTGGYVGIGTAAPNAPLHVTGTTLIGGNLTVGDISAQAYKLYVNAGNSAVVIDGGADTTYLQVSNSVSSGTLTTLATSGNFVIRNSASPIQLTTSTNIGVVVDATGKVGIGSSTPTVALDVNGTVNATAFTMSVGNVATGTTFIASFNNQPAGSFVNITLPPTINTAFQLICCGFDDGSYLGGMDYPAAGLGMWMLVVGYDTAHYNVGTISASSMVSVTLTSFTNLKVTMLNGIGAYSQNYHFKLVNLGSI